MQGCDVRPKHVLELLRLQPKMARNVGAAIVGSLNRYSEGDGVLTSTLREQEPPPLVNRIRVRLRRLVPMISCVGYLARLRTGEQGSAPCGPDSVSRTKSAVRDKRASA